jgi:hypothetical protein
MISSHFVVVIAATASAAVIIVTIFMVIIVRIHYLFLFYGIRYIVCDVAVVFIYV